MLGHISLVLGHNLEPPGHAVGQLLRLLLGGAQDLDDVLGGPQGQVGSGKHGVSVVTIPNFILNVGQKNFTYKNCRPS